MSPQSKDLVVVIVMINSDMYTASSVQQTNTHCMFISGPLGSFLMRETVVFYARWAWEHQVWCVWSMRSSHQGSHLFVWVLLWHNSSWNAIWVWAFLSRRTKAKERMNHKINDHFTFQSTFLHHWRINQTKTNHIRGKQNFIAKQTGELGKGEHVCL